MKYCCNDITSLGCFDSCSTEIKTKLVADQTGIWSALAEFAGSNISFVFSATSGTEINFPNIFNEDYLHIVKIFRADGTIFDNKCFSLKTFTSIKK